MNYKKKMLAIICVEWTDCKKEYNIDLKICQETKLGYNLTIPFTCKCGKEYNQIKYPYLDDEGNLICPKCKSTQLTASNKGFGLGKAAVGGILLGPVGLLGGLIGSKKVMITCLKCGYQWKVGK